MDNSIQTIFASEDLRLDRVHLPLDESGNKTALAYNLYIRVNSKQHELYEDVARDLDYTYMDTDEYDGLKPTPGIEYDHYFKFV